MRRRHTYKGAALEREEEALEAKGGGGSEGERVSVDNFSTFPHFFCPFYFSGQPRHFFCESNPGIRRGTRQEAPFTQLLLGSMTRCVEVIEELGF